MTMMTAVSSWFANPHGNNSNTSSGISGVDRYTTGRYYRNQQQQQQLQQQQQPQRRQRTVKELVHVLYPKRSGASVCGIVGGDGGGTTSSNGGDSISSSSYYGGGGGGSSSTGGSSRRRFSQLLLEHGEKQVQDWAVVAYSTPDYNTYYHHQDEHHHHQQHKQQQQQQPNNNNNNNQQQQQQQSNNKEPRTNQQQQQKKQITWYQSPAHTKKSLIHGNNNNHRTNNGNSTTAINNNNTHTSGRNTTGVTSYHHHHSQHHHRSMMSQQQQQQQLLVDKDLYPTMHMKNIQGRLYLCTNSLVFEPNDPSRGIVRCPFAKMEYGPPIIPETSENNTNIGTNNNNNNNTTTKQAGNNNNSNRNNSNSMSSSYETLLTVQFTCRRHFVMKEDNTIGPYRQVSIPSQFRLTFLHSSPTNFLELCTSLYYNNNNINTASRNSKQQQQQQHHHQRSNSYSNSRQSLVPSIQPNQLSLLSSSLFFDVSNFVDVREQMQTGHIPCSLLSPLQCQTGVIVLTNERMYFQHQNQYHYYASQQPQQGNISSSSSSSSVGGGGGIVQKWHYHSVVAVARRYNGLRDSALEIYFQDNSDIPYGSSSNESGSYYNRKKKSNNNTTDNRYYSSILLGFERRHDRELVLRCLQQGGGNGNNNSSYIDPNINIDSNNNNNNTIPCFTDREFVMQVVQEWMKGNISNYDYLLAINSAAGRSFHDLSRYPVFPWIIRDYQSSKLDLLKESTYRDLSKPVGALNDERLAYFRKRLSGMQDMEEAFLYGTHYSAPGYVLYYLVRSMPEHMLCLQNGKFDSPDRMFHSIANCYNCALTNHADVKELIPEFYHPSCDYDFLINARGLQLGATQNGERVDDVKLPPWAKSPRDFIKQNRAALESDICTRTLPKWIDLIFGYKSRGKDALDADNVFHQYAYLGPSDLASMQSEEERYTAELQATEFGIVPDQLFTQQHPAKIGMIMNSDDVLTMVDECLSSDIGRASVLKDDPTSREAWELLDIPVVPGSNGDDHNNALDSYNNREPDFQQHGQRNSSQRNRQASYDNDVDDSDDIQPVEIMQATVIEADGNFSPPQRLTDNVSTTGSGPSWDMKIIERKQIHNDAVSSCVLLFDDDNAESNLSILATTSLDGGLKVHNVSLDSQIIDEAKNATGGGGPFASPLNLFSNIAIMNRGQQPSAAIQSVLSDYRTHSARDPLASLVLTSDGTGGTVAFAGGHDDVVLAYGVKSACAVTSVYSHRDAVTGLALIQRTPFDSDSSIWLEKSTHIMVSGSWDATVKVWSASVSGGETVAINREPLAELFDADSSIVCVSAMASAMSMSSYSGEDKGIRSSILIAAGCADGSFCVWNLHNDGVQVLIHREPPPVRKGSGPCSVVQWVSEAGNLYLFAAYSTSGKVASYSLIDDSLKRESAVSLGVAVQSLAHDTGLLLVGCADGGIRLLSIVDGVYFDSKPALLWTAVNNTRSSPGISSISLTYKEETETEAVKGSKSSRSRRCIGCSGAEDGSIVLFELRKV